MSNPTEGVNPFRQIVQPFIDVVRAPRALWGVNVGYMIEGMCYFGVVGYLAMYFNEYVGLSDQAAGINVGVAQFPWFLTKMLTSLYSGWFLARYCPDPALGTPLDTGTMWFVYGIIASASTVMLVLAKGWIGKDFKTRHAAA
jgi:dipeptide/tripeptide permease